MPRHCSIAGCRSNYDTEKEYTATFSLPKKEPLRSKWLKKIPNDVSGLKNPIICIKHFPESAIIRVDRIMVKGELKEYPRTLPKYAENSVPSIFPKLSSSSSSSSSSSLSEEQLTIKEESDSYLGDMENSVELDCTQENSINSLDDVLQHMKEYKNKRKCWVILEKQEKLALCCMKTDSDCPSVSASIIVDQNLKFTVYFQNTKINVSRLPHKGKIENFQKLEDLLLWVETSQNLDDNTILDTVVSLLKSLPNYEESNNLQFLVEQLVLSLSPKNRKRYTNQSMVFASCLYIHSSNAYNALLKSGLLHLPHPQTLQKFINKSKLTK